MGATATLLTGCKKIQNKAARLVTLSKKYDHITPVLEDLHWLPLEYRIRYKALLHVFNCVNDMSPVYLKELVNVYTPTRNLRSNDSNLLCIPKSKLSFHFKAFSVFAPHYWNALDNDIRKITDVVSFKKSLKTHLFREAFNIQ